MTVERPSLSLVRQATGGKQQNVSTNRAPPFPIATLYMPPKTNKQREKLEQSQASSRAKAQDLLRGTGGFIGFSNFARAPAAGGNPSKPSASTNPFAALSTSHAGGASTAAGATYAIDESSGPGGAASAMYVGADHEITMVLKMLSKKGTVTKTKALHSLMNEIIPQKSPPEIRAMVGHFVQLYTFEVRDQKDRKVRQLLNEVLLAMTTKLKPKAFIPHLRRLLPYWLMAMHDPNKEAGVAAKKALEVLFPDNTEMQAEVIATHLGAIMEEYSMFFQHNADTFPGVTLTESDEREERYERCVAAAILSIESIIQLFAKTDKIAKLSAEDTAFSVAGVVSSDKFGKLVSATSKNANFTRDAIRKATYTTLKTLASSAFRIIQARVEYFAKLVLGAFSDKYPGNQQELWDMVLTFLQVAGPTLWALPEAQSVAKFLKSAVLPRLFAQVRHGFFGSARSSFPVLLPLMSMIPLEHVIDSKSATCALYSGVLENAWKFIASNDGRYYEEVVIQSAFECLRAYNDFFLRSPTNRAAAKRILGDENGGCEDEFVHDAQRVNAYVNQFEKTTKASITLLLTSPKLAVRNVKVFADEWKSMLTKLRAATDPVSRIVAQQFVDSCENWLAAVLETLPSIASADSSRVSAFLQGVDPAKDGESHFRLVASGKQLYKSCLAQLKSAETAPHALELMNVLFEVFGAEVVDAGESQETYMQHYESHVQPLAHEAGGAPSGEDCATFANAVLRVARQFFLLVDDKKAFVLQLFRDFDVQYGDMKKATLLVDACFRVPLSADSVSQWLTSGSFSRTSPPVSETSVAHPLYAVWKGKLVDEFVMISLKGRLDDLDGDAFSALLQSCLGGENGVPVLSPDLVVILSHFVVQQSESEVAMRVIPTLVSLFGRLGLSGDDDSTPAELRSAEDQLYTTLFHLAAKSNFKVEAETLWKEKVQTAVSSTWTSVRRLEFVNSLAKEINDVFSSTSGDQASGFSSRIWASYCERYLDLATSEGSVDDSLSVFALINRLTIFDLRFEGSRSDLTTLYDRLLSCLGEWCEDDVSRLSAYFEELLFRDATHGIQLLQRLADIDLCHGLTFAMLQSESMAALARDSMLAPVDYISLQPLYASLASHLPQLIAAVQASALEGSRYRKVLFLNQQTELELISDDVDAIEDLSAEDHAHLDRLLTALLVSLLTTAAAGEYGSAWLAQPRASPVSMDQIVRVLAAYPEDEEATAILKSILAKSSEVLPQWPSPAGVQALKVFISAWALNCHIAFDASVHHSLLLKLSRAFASASPSSLDEWVDAATYLAALPSAWGDAEVSEDTMKRWSLAAQGVLLYALGGKAEGAEVARLNVHKRVLPATLDNGDHTEQLTTEAAQPLARSRRAIVELLRVMAVTDNGASVEELPREQRDVLVSTVLTSLAEALTSKANALPTYLELHNSSKSLRIIQLSAEVDALVDGATETIPRLTAVINDATLTKTLLVEAFVSVKALAACFNTEKTKTPPHARAVLYTVCTYTGVFKSSVTDTAGVDINADDEAAAEAALAKSLIPAGLRAALKASFSAGAKQARPKGQTRRQQRRSVEGEDFVGRLLVWDLFIQLFPDSGSRDGGHLGMRSSALCAYVAKNGLLSTYLSLCGELLHRETGAQSLVAQLKLSDQPLYSLKDVEDGDQEWMGEVTAVTLAAQSFFRTVLRLPAMVRTWWNDECSRSLRSWASKYFEEHITPYVLAFELDIIQKASQNHSWDTDEMAVKGSKVSREITTTYFKDECALEMVIRVPSSYPLRSVEVECTRRIGITEDRWRRWVLQIIKVTSAQDGSLLDAVLLWKQNVDKEFEGVEPCPICYSILNPKTMGLPNLSCKTCANKYHNSCLYKWFNQSGKNKCPICQQPFT